MKRILISLGIATISVSTFFFVEPIRIDSVQASDMIENASDATVVNSGNFGTAPYQLTSDGVLHIQAGELSSGSLAPSISNRALVTKIIFEGDVKGNVDSSQAFSAFTNLVSIEGMENFDTSKVTNMSFMFADLTKLTNVDLSEMDTSSATSMMNMFTNCGIKNPNVTNWDVRKVLDFTTMFGQSQIESIDLSAWKPESATTMQGLLGGTSNLKSVTMFKDFYGITNIQNMFANSSIEEMDASGWIMNNVTNMEGLFQGLTELTSIDVSDWQFPTTGVNMNYLFLGDQKLSSLDLSTWNNIDNNVYGYLAFTNLNQIKLGSNTAIKDSLIGMQEGEDEEQYYLGQWLNKENDSLISGEDFSNSNYPAGNYDFIASDDVLDDVVIQTDQGDKTVKYVIVKSTDLSDIVVIQVPTVEGYTPDKTQVLAQVVQKTDSDGQTVNKIEVINPLTDGFVTYIKDGEDSNSGNNTSSGSNSSSSKPEIIKVNRLVTTHPNNGDVTLYKKNLTKVTNRALAQSTSWYSDQQMTKGGVTYYRVATNEWAKDSSVYIYEDHSLVIQTGSDTQLMVTSQGEKVINRALAKNTLWKVDQLAYIDNQTYYRVATNEFVPTTEVTKKALNP